MSILISVLSQKGGAGKSTIARLLAVEAAKLGKHTKIADLDLTQATSVTWNNRRMQINRQPALEAQTYGAVAQAIRDAVNFDLMIVDGAPSASRAALEAATASVLTIIPTRPSLDDLRPALASHETWSAMGSLRITSCSCSTRQPTAQQKCMTPEPAWRRPASPWQRRSFPTRPATAERWTKAPHPAKHAIHRCKPEHKPWQSNCSTISRAWKEPSHGEAC
ncbi:MAG: ParA family protein [Candidatus Competibacteraceae bacterium]|nr:ParA family protein [Candidatus Competibacteraceae bacterium]